MTTLSQSEVLTALYDELTKNEDFKKSLGRQTTIFLLATLAIVSVELIYGLPVVTLATTPIAGAILAYLGEQARSWLVSGRPEIVFFFCPGCLEFRSVRWSDMPKYRKIKACEVCGQPFIRRCQAGRHFIVSPDLSMPAQQPQIDRFCQYCDVKLPEVERRLLPEHLRAKATAVEGAADDSGTDDSGKNYSWMETHS